MGVESVIRELGHADSFVDIGRVANGLNREIDLGFVIVEVWSRTLRPIAMVDNVDDSFVPTNERARYATSVYRVDPVRNAMLATRAAVGSEIMSGPEYTRWGTELGWRGPVVHPLNVPLVDDVDVIGALRLGCGAEVPRLLRRDILRFAGHVSVRFAKLGIGAVDEDQRFAALTARQLEVARLVAEDWTNREIADALQISLDTVKKHVKDLFVRLGLASRHELRGVLLRQRPLIDVPVGITPHGEVTTMLLELGA